MDSQDKILATRSEAVAALTNLDYKGSDGMGGSLFPPVVNILQNDKQYVAFDEDSQAKITKPMYGKLFVRFGENSINDLVETVTGVLLKVQKGHEFVTYVDDNGNKIHSGKVYESHNGLMGKADKDNFNAVNMPDRKVRNMVKLVILLEDGRTALVPIKGGSWGAWMDAENSMRSKAISNAEYGHKRSDDLPVCVWRLTFGSDFQKMDGNTGYFTFSIPKIEMLDPVDAQANIGEMSKYQDLDLFYRVADVYKDAPEESDESAIEVETKKVETIDDAFPDVEEESIEGLASKMLGN